MDIKREKIKVYGMTCRTCENRVAKSIRAVNGVTNVMVSYNEEYALVEFDAYVCNSKHVKEAIVKGGYSVNKDNKFNFIGIAVIAIVIFMIGNSSTGFDINSKLQNASLIMLFVVGVLTSVHCVGMCGGIMISQSINKDSNDKSKYASIKPALLYNLGRITAYTIIGGIVGAIGSVISISIGVKAFIQIAAGIFMVIMGLNMSGFNILRKLNIKLPWNTCAVKHKVKAPFLVGMLNGLMPCGPLQAMQLYALGTGSALAGATSMFVFSLGTVPLMLGFGVLSGLLSKDNTKMILKFSGIMVVVLGLIMGSRGLALSGFDVRNIAEASQTSGQSLSGDKNSNALANFKPEIVDGVQIIRMTADAYGYTPNTLYVQKNMPVKWIIDGKSINSCNGTIIVPSLNIQKNLKSGENVIEFKAGDKDINFSCGMGMIRGKIIVVDDVKAIDPSKVQSAPAPTGGGMGCCGGGGGVPTPPSN